MLAVGSSVAFQPHTINMSLWRGRGAPGMLTCGRAALTTIDKRVRWLLVIKIPGGESYIGGHLTSRLEGRGCQFPFWLKSLTKACYLFTPNSDEATNHTIVYRLSDLGRGQKCT